MSGDVVTLGVADEKLWKVLVNAWNVIVCLLDKREKGEKDGMDVDR